MPHEETFAPMDEQLRARYEALQRKVSGQRKEAFDRFIAFLERETQWLTAPASYRESFHRCVEGGLLEHSVAVAETMLQLRDTLAPDVPDESCVIVGLLHDCGKVGAPGVPRYLPNPDQWQVKNRGIRYTINPNLVHLNLAARSLYLVARHIPLSDEEAQAILYHDGQYVEANREVAHRETRLTLLVTFADTWTGMMERRQAAGG